MSRNLLSKETSPYLLQHKDNPVHWQPWGEGAFAESRKSNRPILLSVGYSACHWCHVMAHESFENQTIADLVNTLYIAVKVDREERPDVDKIYMDALHALGQPGGWPLTMFLTPDGQPFWGGTYFPPEPRYGRPSFPHVLQEIHRIWNQDHDKAKNNARIITAAISSKSKTVNTSITTDENLLDAATTLSQAIDVKHGGITGAPKFPQAPIFDFICQSYQKNRDPALLKAVTTTLTNISQGGIYDHLGGGLARYSVDAMWLIPHFEKMLYDNAQFVALLTRVWVLSNDPLFHQRIDETIVFVTENMMAEGAFASSYDADSSGEEGKYYVWSKQEIDLTLQDAAPQFSSIYGVVPEGNWEGHNILNRLSNPDLLPPDTEHQLSISRKKLLEQRTTRTPPSFDDKLLADWNGLMISALADAALVFNQPHWQEIATLSFKRIIQLLWKDGILHHSYRAKQTRGHATADGYANLTSAALALHALSGDPSYLGYATALSDTLIENFWDPQGSSFFFSDSRATDLFTRPKFLHDDATPNANATMLKNLTKLHALTGNHSYKELCNRLITANCQEALGNPFAHAAFLAAIQFHIEPVQAILARPEVLKPDNGLLNTFATLHGPQAIIGHVTDTQPLPRDHPAFGKTSTTRACLYLCRGNTCTAPAFNSSEIKEALKTLQLLKN